MYSQENLEAAVNNATIQIAKNIKAGEYSGAATVACDLAALLQTVSNTTDCDANLEAAVDRADDELTATDDGEDVPH